MRTKEQVIWVAVIAVSAMTNGKALAQKTFASLHFESGQVVAKGVSSHDTDGCKLEDRYEDSHHLYFTRGNSLTFEFTVGHDVSKATLKVKHLSSASDGKPGKTPIAVYVNGEKVTSWNQLETSYRTDEVDVSKYVRKGTNRVKFEYAKNEGTTGYWQKWVQVYVW